MKQTLKIGITALVMAALTMSGIALAQTDDDATDEEAAAPGVSVIVEKLAPLIEDGTITEPQAEAVAEQLADGFGHRRGPQRGSKGLEAAAEFLDMEIEDCRSPVEGRRHARRDRRRPDRRPHCRHGRRCARSISPRPSPTTN